jgi:predicted CoA-binding protein
MIDPAQAKAFLSAGRIAVVGASDDPRNFGRSIVSALTEHGVDTVAVHPEATTVAGAPSYSSLTVIPGEVDAVIVMVPKDVAASVVQACADRGVTKVWLFKGVGPGAVTDEAIRLCHEHGMSVVAGACPLMFLEPVSGVHRFHRAIRRARGSVGKAA